MVKGLEQVRSGHGVVHRERDSRPMGDPGYDFEVVHVVFRVPHRFGVDQASVLIDGPADVFRVRGVDEPDRYPQSGQSIVEEVVGSAIEIAGGDDILPGAGDVEHRIGDCRLPRGEGKRAYSAVKFCQALFQHIAGRIHDPRVDIAELPEAEEIGRVVGAAERIGRGLVNGNRTRQRGRIRLLAGVECEGIEAFGDVGHDGTLLSHATLPLNRSIVTRHNTVYIPYLTCQQKEPCQPPHSINYFLPKSTVNSRSFFACFSASIPSL